MNKIETLMKESGIEINDVRWYLTVREIKKIYHLQKKPFELAQYICSKELEANLYEMEQCYIDQLQTEWDLKRIDEAGIREILYNINREKRLRREKRLGIDLSSSSL